MGSAGRIFRRFRYRLSRIAEFARSISENRILSDRCDRTEIGILLRGGIGDAMIAARWLHALMPRLATAGDFVIDIYYAHPESILFIFGNFGRVRYIYHDITFDYVSRYYSVALVLNHLGFLELKRFRRQAVGANLALSQLVDGWAKASDRFKRFSNRDYHPALGAGFAHLIQADGFRRDDILEHQTSDPAPISPFPFCFSEKDSPPDHAVLRGPYITLHDGWDWQLRLGTRRPTKAYPREKWASLVRKLKQRHPELPLVQIGGAAGADIPGVDLNLRNAIPLPAAAQVLRKSILHIDTDSGLVHVAASLGTRAVVMFGPTDIRYYGYPGNINVHASGCNNCWLSSDSWVASCVIGDIVPRCMASISEDRILLAVRQALTAAPAASR